MFHVKHEKIQTFVDLDLSESVVSRLQSFADLLTHWNARINLVSRSALADLWPRHIADSLQLIPCMPDNLSSAIDLGAGAGFPGLVLAIATGIPFTLIEANQRKAAFLTEAARLTNAPVRVQNARIEQVQSPRTRLLTARALAPLPALLAFAEPLLAPDGVALFPKGKNVEAELTRAARQWHMHLDRLPSRTNPEASVLRVSEVRRV